MTVTEVSFSPTSPVPSYTHQRWSALKEAAHTVQRAVHDAWADPTATAKNLCGRVEAILTSKGARHTAIAAMVVMVAIKVKDREFCNNLYLNAAVKKVFEVGADQSLRALLFA